MLAARILRVLAVVGLLLLAVSPCASTAADWQIDAGAGVISAPRSLGSGRQLTIPVPVIEARYRDWFFATDNPIEGIGVAKKLENGLRLTASLGVDLDTRDSGADPHVQSLPKVGAAAAARGRVEYETQSWFSSLTVSERLAGSNSRGLTGAAEFGYNVLATERVLASVGLDERLMDATWARNFLTVTHSQALSGDLPAYRAGAGQLDAGVFLQGLYRLGDRWTVFSRVQYSRFGGDAAASPVVSNRNSVLGLLFIVRAF
jgi:outer membrane scaffolding protein for murein synthesis (MipA/OmpV family)